MKCEICGHEVDQPLVVAFKGETHTFCCLDCIMHFYRPKGKDTALENALKQQRASVVQDIEGERGTKLITMIHRLESERGEREYITIEDSEEVLQQIRVTDLSKPIELPWLSKTTLQRSP